MKCLGIVILVSGFGLVACDPGPTRKPAAAPAAVASSAASTGMTANLPPQIAVVNTERLPLTRILAIVRARVSGEVIEVEMDKDGGRETYEVTVLTLDGRKIEVTMDAQTGRLLGHEED